MSFEATYDIGDIFNQNLLHNIYGDTGRVAIVSKTVHQTPYYTSVGTIQHL